MGSLEKWMLPLVLVLGMLVIVTSMNGNQGQVVVVTTQPPSSGPTSAVLFLGAVFLVLMVFGQL